MSRMSWATAVLVAPGSGGVTTSALLLLLTLAMAPAFLASFEKAGEGRFVRLIGAQFDGINAGRSENAFEVDHRFDATFGKAFTTARVARIDLCQFTGFGVAQDQDAEIWKFGL